MAKIRWAKPRAIFLRDANLALAYPVSFWLQWVGIFISVVGFYYVSKLVAPSTALGFDGRPSSYFAYVVVNVAFVSFQSTALTSFQRSIRTDQMMGTLEAMLATPTRLEVLVLSASLWAFTVTAMQVACYLLFASLLFGLDLGHVDLTSGALFVVLTAVTMSSIGVMSAAAVMLFKQAGPTRFLVGGAASLLGGVLFPVTMLPPPAQVVSWFLPITHALAGIRGAVNGASLATLLPDAVWLGVAALLLFPLSLFVFSKAVKRAKFDGTLANY